MRRNIRRAQRFDAYLEHLNDFDEDRSQWQGTCPRCNTSHDGWPPDTISGILRCRRTRVSRIADTTMWAPVAWLAQHWANRLDHKIAQHEQPRP